MSVIRILLLYTAFLGLDSDPVSNYMYFVKFLNDHYGLFPYKGINWDSLSRNYLQNINANTSSDSLFFKIAGLASNLRDKHVWIDNEKYVYNYSIGRVVPVSQMDSIFNLRRRCKNIDSIKSIYLHSDFVTSGVNDFIYGKINTHTGYLSLSWFDKDVKKVNSEMERIIYLMKDCNSLIVDIRNNIGGTDSSALAVANYLSVLDTCYQISRIRTGIDNYSYSVPDSWSTAHKKIVFDRPIIVLANRYTISAAETFLLALKTQSHIKFLGEPTAGAFSDTKDGYLPNGWHFTYSIGVWTDCNDVLWEEKGIQPDIYQRNIIDDCTSDSYIEKALEVLNTDVHRACQSGLE